MSTETSGDDREQPGRTGPSEDEARELVERLRSTPAEEIITDLFSMLLSTAEVKRGRRDARLFIDLCALSLEYSGRYVSEDLSKRVGTALGQLRLGQVSAEREAARRYATGGESEPNDLTLMPTPPTAGSGRGSPA